MAKERASKPAAAATSRGRSADQRAGDTSEFTRAVDQGGAVKRGEVKDDSGGTLYWARRPFGYAGLDLDRGQVVSFRGLVNDEKLIRLGYVLSLLPKDRPHKCRYCPAQFIDLSTLDAHGKKRHAEKEPRVALPTMTEAGLTVDETAGQVQRFEREQTRLDKEAPLNLDKTTASREAGA